MMILQMTTQRDNCNYCSELFCPINCVLKLLLNVDDEDFLLSDDKNDND